MHDESPTRLRPLRRYHSRRMTHAPNLQPAIAVTGDRIDTRLASLCKPPGSLGELEALARRLAVSQGTTTPTTTPRRVVVFAADHGVTAEGVSAWPSSVTAAVTRLMPPQRTASGVFAKQLDAAYEVVDVGLLTPVAGTRDAAVRRGTGNLRIEPAMTAAEFEAACDVGRDRASAAADTGCRLVIGGEMGIGNTTPAACLIAKLTGCCVDDVIGRGAGLDDAGLDRKRAVVGDALARIVEVSDVHRIGAEVGGLEIAALAGFYQQAAKRELTIVLDGFIATAAALLAQAVDPSCTARMVAAHRSAERGHQIALAHLGLTPVLDLGMRLGEASGALVALPLLDLAAAMMRDMATLDDLQLGGEQSDPAP